MKHEIKWLDQPELHDFPAAFDCISMEYGEDRAKEIVEKLRAAKVTHRKAKDIARLSRHTPLDASNHHVAHNLKKIEKGEALSPIILVSGKPLLVADGWHRTCAVLIHDEDHAIPCLLV